MSSRIYEAGPDLRRSPRTDLSENPPRVSSLSDLLSLEPEDERAVAPAIAAPGSPPRQVGDLPPALPARRALESLLAAGSVGSAPVEIPPAEGTGRPLELLNDLADRALRRQDGLVPDSVPDRADLPAVDSPASRPWPPASPVDKAGKDRLLALEAGIPELQPVPALAVSGGPPLLDAETLADLINEALVEQARRHGVDLS